MPDLIRHPVFFFLDFGFRRNNGMRGKPRGSEPEVNKKAGPVNFRRGLYQMRFVMPGLAKGGGKARARPGVSQ
jgi:hypothetical protein